MNIGRGRIVDATFLGETNDILVSSGDYTIRLRIPAAERMKPGEDISFELDARFAQGFATAQTTKSTIDFSHERGFKVSRQSGGRKALALAHKYKPAAVSLDVFLRDMLGRSVLSQLKQDPQTRRHIPVRSRAVEFLTFQKIHALPIAQSCGLRICPRQFVHRSRRIHRRDEARINECRGASGVGACDLALHGRKNTGD